MGNTPNVMDNTDKQLQKRLQDLDKLQYSNNNGQNIVLILEYTQDDPTLFHKIPLFKTGTYVNSYYGTINNNQMLELITSDIFLSCTQSIQFTTMDILYLEKPMQFIHSDKKYGEQINKYVINVSKDTIMISRDLLNGINLYDKDTITQIKINIQVQYSQRVFDIEISIRNSDFL